MYENPELRALLDDLTAYKRDSFDQNSYSAIFRGLSYGDHFGQQVDLLMLDLKNNIVESYWVESSDDFERKIRKDEFARIITDLDLELDVWSQTFGPETVSKRGVEFKGDYHVRFLEKEERRRIDDFLSQVFGIESLEELEPIQEIESEYI